MLLSLCLSGLTLLLPSQRGVGNSLGNHPLGAYGPTLMCRRSSVVSLTVSGRGWTARGLTTLPPEVTLMCPPELNWTPNQSPSNHLSCITPPCASPEISCITRIPSGLTSPEYGFPFRNSHPILSSFRTLHLFNKSRKTKNTTHQCLDFRTKHIRIVPFVLEHFFKSAWGTMEVFQRSSN